MNIEEIFKLLDEQFPDAVELDKIGDKPPVAVILLPVRFHEIMTFLRNSEDLNFDSLESLSGVDYPDKENINVIYHLFSTTHLHSLTVKIHLKRKEPLIDTVCDIWKIANWHERECYDLFGVEFKSHPELRRILLPDDWEGFPLRRDYKTPESYCGMSIKGSLEESAGKGGRKHIR